MEKSFKITTFNTGLLKVLTKDIVPFVDARLPMIIAELKNLDTDIICLQEVFESRHFEQIHNSLKSFPFSVNAKARNFLKSPGLCIFSKFPIIECFFERFRDHQDVENFWNHGFQKAKIEIFGKVIEIFNVHLTSGGLTGNLESKRASKVAGKQVEQLFKHVDSPKNTILTGDFNCGPMTDNKTYEQILDKNFDDTLIDEHLLDNTTWDNQNYLVAKQGFDMPTDRIDHLFLSTDSELKQEKHEMVLNQTYLREPFNLSDHYGVNFKIVL